jgi:hypothetical protein
MKTLLLLNGPDGWQVGIEDGFVHLKETGMVAELRWFYFEAYSWKHSVKESLQMVMKMAAEFLPELIVIFHIKNFPIGKEEISILKKLDSKPIIAYDEGDMYGTWAKPLPSRVKNLAAAVDVVSLRGTGKLYQRFSGINPNAIYTPHHAELARFDREPYLLKERENSIIFIGNKIKPRILSSIRRMPGALERERFVRDMGKAFPETFRLYGEGWKGFTGDRGAADFMKQMDYYRNTWITVAYEHYPDEPDYFSNRLPIALMAGSLYVCHYHRGYEKIFAGCDFIFFFHTNEEAVGLVKKILSFTKEDLFERSKRAREFSISHYHPNVTWTDFFKKVISPGIKK